LRTPASEDEPLADERAGSGHAGDPLRFRQIAFAGLQRLLRVVPAENRQKRLGDPSRSPSKTFSHASTET
jgi:hypothetical protein